MSHLCRRPAMRKKERGREEGEIYNKTDYYSLLGCVDTIPFPAGVHNHISSALLVSSAHHRGEHRCLLVHFGAGIHVT